MSDISRNNLWNYICSLIISMRFFILIFLLTSYTYSQVESSNRKIELPPPAKKTLIPPVTKQNPNSFTILKNPTNLQKSVMEQDTEYFADPGKKYLKRLKVEEDKRNPNEYLGDAYLGDVSTVSKKANIVCRDFEYMDGDRVSILVNDEVVVENLTLTYEFRGINLKLKEGFNKIDFVALNQGSSGPNTAELRIYDDSENLLSANQWNLATGSTATLIIVKK